MEGFIRAVRAAAPDDAPQWTSISTHQLLAELRRRGEDAPNQKPECGSRERGHYDTPAHVFALFLILTLSTLSCSLPLLSRRTTPGRKRTTIIFYCQHVGTGVLLATAFVHLLPMAFESLTDPCLPYFFSEGYTPLPGFVAMVAAIVVVGVESFLTARGAGHSHSHVHDFWDSSDDGGDSTSQIPLQEVGGGLSERRIGGHRPDNLALGDDEAAVGLVAGVSPLPESTPVITENGNKPEPDDDFNDADSDLHFETSELHQAQPTDRRDSQYASLNARTSRDDPGPPKTTQTPEEHKRQVLQCLLLEAGILFHSVFIGMAISVATGPAFVVFLIAISFHQSFEGLALGSRIAAIHFPKKSLHPWLMALAFGVTTPIGQAIGLVVHRMYDPRSMAGLLVVGFMNAISAGLLLYAGLVQLLAEDFLTEKSYKTLKGKRRLRAYLAVVGGSLMMAVVGAFA